MRALVFSVFPLFGSASLCPSILPRPWGPANPAIFSSTDYLGCSLFLLPLRFVPLGSRFSPTRYCPPLPRYERMSNLGMLSTVSASSDLFFDIPPSPPRGCFFREMLSQNSSPFLDASLPLSYCGACRLHGMEMAPFFNFPTPSRFAPDNRAHTVSLVLDCAGFCS